MPAIIPNHLQQTGNKGENHETKRCNPKQKRTGKIPSLC